MKYHLSIQTKILYNTTLPSTMTIVQFLGILKKFLEIGKTTPYLNSQEII